MRGTGSYNRFWTGSKSLAVCNTLGVLSRMTSALSSCPMSVIKTSKTSHCECTLGHRSEDHGNGNAKYLHSVVSAASGLAGRCLGNVQSGVGILHQKRRHARYSQGPWWRIRSMPTSRRPRHRGMDLLQGQPRQAALNLSSPLNYWPTDDRLDTGRVRWPGA